MLNNRRSPVAKLMDRYIGIPLVLLRSALWRMGLCWRGRSRSDKRTPSKILTIKFSGMGDGIVMLPALTAVKRLYPNAEIQFLGGDSIVPWMKELPWITKTYRWSRHKLLSQLRREHFDLVIDFDQWLRITALISASVGAKERWGFRSAGQWRHYLYSKHVDLRFDDHMAKNFWRLVVGRGQDQDSPEQWFRDKQQSQVEFKDHLRRLLIPMPNSSQPFFILHPGCGSHGQMREWPLTAWIDFVRRLPQDHEVIVTGEGIYEKSLADELSRASERPITNAVGRYSILQFARLLMLARGVVTGNTGAMHLASLVDAKLIALHGPTNAKLWGPLWQGQVITTPAACGPCLTWGADYGCSDPVCMGLIKPTQVFEAAMRVGIDA